MEEERYAAPSSDLVNSPLDSEEEQLASRWSRLWASLLDVLTILPFTLLITYLTGGFNRFSEGMEPSFTYSLMISVLGILIFLAIHGSLMFKDGQTWGKKALRIKIVMLDGAPVNVKALAKRYGFFWLVPQIPIIGQFINLVNILFVFSKAKRCLHDYLGDTKVVRVGW